ncbi:MAG: molecular chaperone TorD family protein [Chloroflexi bacterium]|nr:molecular chaperone TorD family protein [Chloroflexota bacterium]
MIETQIVLYRLLAQSLIYPDKHFVANLQSAVGKINLEVFDDGRLPLGAFVRALRELARLPLDQIQGEYTRLFVNAYPHVPCPPYESAYRDGEVLGNAAEQVDVLYRQWELVVEGEQVDQASVELEFIAFLLVLDLPQAREAAEQFRAAHLLRWLPRLADDLDRASRLEFYRAVGRVLRAVLCQAFTAVESMT